MRWHSESALLARTSQGITTESSGGLSDDPHPTHSRCRPAPPRRRNRLHRGLGADAAAAARRPVRDRARPHRRRSDHPPARRDRARGDPRRPVGRIGRPGDRAGGRQPGRDPRRHRAHPGRGHGREPRRGAAPHRRQHRPRGPPRLAVPRRPSPTGRTAGVRGADHRRAGHARVRLRPGLHRDAHAQADGHRVRVGRGGVRGRLLRPQGLPGAVAAVLQAGGDRGRRRPGLRGRPGLPGRAVVHRAARDRVHRGGRGAGLDRRGRGRDGLRGADARARAGRGSGRARRGDQGALRGGRGGAVGAVPADHYG